MASSNQRAINKHLDATLATGEWFKVDRAYEAPSTLSTVHKDEVFNRLNELHQNGRIVKPVQVQQIMTSSESSDEG